MANYEKQAKQTPQKETNSTLKGVITTNIGSHIAPVYKRVFDEDSGLTLVKKVDEFNLFEFIQASKSQTDLATLQKRFMELGEIPNVDPSMVYSDTVMPSNIHELYNMVNDVNGSFNSLPESVRNVFGDAQSYLQAILNGTANDKLAAAFLPKNDKQNEAETKGEEE